MNQRSHAAMSVDDAESIVSQAVSEFERPLTNYAYSLLKDVDRARDVVQETFVKLCQQAPSTFEGSLKAWLFTVCRNRALDILKKNRRMTTIDSLTMDKLESQAPCPAQQTSQKDIHQRALTLLEKLPTNQREVIRLRFQSDLSYREISKITQLSESNVGFLLHTGLKSLRALMAS